VSHFENPKAAYDSISNRSVHPRIVSQIESVTKNKDLARALADIGNQETCCPHFAARGSGSVRKPDERHAEKTEVGVDERDSLIDTNARVGRIELPLGVRGVADGDQGAMNDVYVSRKTRDVQCLEVQWIVRNQEHRVGPPLDLDVSPHVVKQ